MKNKNVLKLALVGALVGIVLFDIVNIVLYLTEGFCVKMENTGSLITGYLISAILGAFLVEMYFKLREIEMSNMSLGKRILYVLVYSLIFIILFQISIILQENVFNSDEGIILLVSVFVAQMILVMMIQLIVFATNKGNVKEINKKIKEKVLEDK